MSAYYNEHDPYAAQWLRNLIDAGHIAPGDVDTRSIEDVCPDDLKSYTQCHFFAGVGVWSAGLRRIGWPDDRPIWTGSCPCQPFSEAGKGGGFDDERHLWPAFFHLITARRPKRVVGEQVASKNGLAWFDLVQADLEGANYAGGAVDLCAAGVGAPHWRQRLWWVASDRLNALGVGLADTGGAERSRRHGAASDDDRRGETGIIEGVELASRGTISNALGVGLADTQGVSSGAGFRDSEPAGCGEPFARYGGATIDVANPTFGRRGELGPPGGPRCGGHADGRIEPGDLGESTIAGPSRLLCGSRDLHRPQRAPLERTGGHAVERVAVADGRDASAERQQRSGGHRLIPQDSVACGMAVADDAQRGPDAAGGHVVNGQETGWIQSPGDSKIHRRALRPGPVNGFWRDADWLFCRDGKWRPARPGSFPLVNGASARMGRLRAFGNAICLEAAVEFLMAAGGVLDRE